MKLNSVYGICTSALIGLVAMSSAEVAEARVINVVNKCQQTIWPGVFTQDLSKGGPDGVAKDGGWELPSGQTSTFNVPDTWTAGRIWGRTDCDFGKPEAQSCSTGACVGGLHCKLPGEPPATLAEFTLDPKTDHYDVSAVDGTNVPLSITADKCPSGSCLKDLNPNCPGQLQRKDGAGKVVGCLSACKAYGGDKNCCTGPNDKQATCPADQVDFYHYFKDNGCQDAYIFPYDEPSGALKTCDGNPSPYTVTFCP